jgi:hypothetical protein
MHHRARFGGPGDAAPDDFGGHDRARLNFYHGSHVAQLSEKPLQLSKPGSAKAAPRFPEEYDRRLP